MTALQNKICSLASPDVSPSELACLVGCDRSTVHQALIQYNLPCKKTRKWSGGKSQLKVCILDTADGKMNSREIAEICKCSAKYVQNVLRKHNKKQLPRGAVLGKKNPAYIAGRMIDLGGYAKAFVEKSHPYARHLNGKNYKMILEHRLVMEKKLDRYILPGETVDHIDGLTLHNDPSNLRLFATNADHLRATLKGRRPNWSAAGFANMKLDFHLRKDLQRVNSYDDRKARGEIRLIQILLAVLKLGINSPYLLGTHHWIEKAQIDCSSQTKIKLALAELCP